MKTEPQKVGRHQCLTLWVRLYQLTPMNYIFSGFVFTPFRTEQVNCLKNEGNAFFKEKNYQKAIICYTAGLKKNCGDQEVNTVLLTNRAAAQFHLGNLSLSLCWKYAMTF